MPLHPSPPTDLEGMVEGFRQVFQTLIDLGHGCSADDFARETTCPGWSVQDHLAHVAAVESYLEGGEHVEVELPERAHLRHEFAEWMEHGVQLRRDRPATEVVAELEVLLHNRLATFADPDLHLDTPVRGAQNSTIPLGDLLTRRLIDVWVHQQDVREALGRPGDLDTAAAATFVAVIERALPKVVARGTDLEEHQTVIVDCTGPVEARMGVRVGRGEDGRSLGHSLFTGEVDEDAAQHRDEDPTTTIVLSTDALTRRAAGRRSTQDTSYRVVGDDDVARRVLDALVVVP